MRSETRRSGTSLIEVMVAMAVFTILLSFAIPIVYRVRGTAGQSRCQNNLRVMGSGLQAYAEINYQFPSAYKSDGATPGWGWGAQILPYLDQKVLYETAGVNISSFAASNPASPTTITQTPLPQFRCPADTGPDLNGFRLNFALSNYRAVAGPTYNQWFVANQDLGGVMFQNSRIDPIDILDGQSNTFLVGECIYDEPTNKWAALWSGMTGLRDGAVYISDVMWWVDDASAVINGPAPQAFSSRHGPGANFLFCDGSVRFMYQGGDVSVLKYLAGRNDGVIVSFNQ